MLLPGRRISHLTMRDAAISMIVNSLGLYLTRTVHDHETGPSRAGCVSARRAFGDRRGRDSLRTWRSIQAVLTKSGEPALSSPAAVRGSAGRWPSGWPRRVRG